MKKLVSVVLICILLVISTSAFSLSVNAGALSAEKYFEYTILDDGSAEITAYHGSDTDVIIPDRLGNTSVSSIAKTAFYNSEIESITIPSSVRRIGWWSFYGCRKLKKVLISEGINEICYGAFMNCTSLHSVILPYTVIKIDSDAFAVNCDTEKNIVDSVSKKRVSRQNYYMDSDFVIRGYSNTAAESYCKENDINFVQIGNIIYGDIDGDGELTVSDFELISSVDVNRKFSQHEKLCLDVNANACVDSEDISLLKSYCSNRIPLSSLPVGKQLLKTEEYFIGRTIYCDGDSVAKGTGTDTFGNPLYSYCDYVAEKCNMQITNRAVAGTTLARQKDKTKDSNKSILERILEMDGFYDVILLDGGFNDVFQKVKIGEVTPDEDKSGKYDEYTTAGAMESICYFLTKNYPDAIKIFVLCHTRTENTEQQEYWNVISAVLEKWGIDCVDISRESELDDTNSEISDQYFQFREKYDGGDGIHPLVQPARKIYGEAVCNKLEEIASQKAEISLCDKPVELKSGDTITRKPSYVGSSKNITERWTSDNPAVAQTDSLGRVLAKQSGTATIRVCTSDGLTASYKVTVRESSFLFDSIKDEVELYINDSISLSCLIKPCVFSFLFRDSYFTSSDTGVVTVSNSGKELTAVGHGKARVTLTTTFGKSFDYGITVH